MPRVQIKPIVCLALLTSDFKTREFFEGYIKNKQLNCSVLEVELDVINVQQHQQQQ